jgi:hypothetical protein
LGRISRYFRTIYDTEASGTPVICTATNPALFEILWK